jgi:hypothetical protein
VLIAKENGNVRTTRKREREKFNATAAGTGMAEAASVFYALQSNILLGLFLLLASKDHQ